MPKNNIGRGNNPKSHGNHRLGDEKPVLKQVNLLPGHWEIIKRIGNGNSSRGVRTLLDGKKPVKNKTLTLICGLPGTGKSTLAEKLHGLAIAVDDYPGLYVDGIYQSQLQKESHQWCLNTVEAWMEDGVEISVHNTNTRNIYRKPYIELADKYGYAVHLITTQAVILPNGEKAISTHNVPAEVIESMRLGWEEFNQIPKTGMTPADVAVQMVNLQRPGAIIFDMDKTIKRPKQGRAFPNSPFDFEFLPEFKQWADGDDNDEIELYIASNQRGIAGEQKTEEFLHNEVELLSESLKKIGLDFNAMYFAPNRNTPDCLIYEDGTWLESPDYNLVFDKPNTGIFQDIIYENPNKVYWIVGDGHTDNATEDWQFAQNCQKLNPDLDVRYVPIELVNLYWTLIKYNE
ncbi:AAA family ATPase [Nostoc sp. UHCC 0926]|uniref:AAA family ATPase n=1 Tax=unclassified Nostoc TaxID=2593658 RepID=UPI00235F3ECB|nr:AAA family ATPase [Nostoc sp. UHCC 0926]WDD33082.1 AAA family ATPase [Nostoc sp. UHCC 0926]